VGRSVVPASIIAVAGPRAPASGKTLAQSRENGVEIDIVPLAGARIERVQVAAVFDCELVT